MRGSFLRLFGALGVAAMVAATGAACGGSGASSAAAPAIVEAGHSDGGPAVAAGVRVLLTGSGLGTPGTDVIVEFHALEGTPFADGTSADASVAGVVVGPSGVDVPVGPSTRPGPAFPAAITVVYPDGRRATTDPAGIVLRRYVRSDVAIDRAQNSQGNASVAIDPTDARRIVATSTTVHEERRYWRTFLHRSTDAGRTWATTELAEALDGLAEHTRTEARVAFDRLGRLHVAYVAIRTTTLVPPATGTLVSPTTGLTAPGSRPPVDPVTPFVPFPASLDFTYFHAESDDLGANWLRVRPVRPAIAGIGSPTFLPTVRLAVGPDAKDPSTDAVHIVSSGHRGVGIGETIEASSCVRDPGTGAYGDLTPSRTVTVYQFGYGGEFAAEVGPAGELVVAWSEVTFGTPQSQVLRVRRDPDGAGPLAFSATLSLDAVIDFDILAAQPHLPVEAAGPTGTRSHGSLLGISLAHVRAGGFTGRLVLAHVDASDPLVSRTASQIVARFSDDGGATWSDPTGVSGVDATHHAPAIVSDPASGVLTLAWLQVDFGDTLARVVSAWSEGGSGWISGDVGSDAASEFRSLSASSGFPAPLGLAATAGGAFAVFPDTSGSAAPNLDGAARSDLYGTWIPR